MTGGAPITLVGSGGFAITNVTGASPLTPVDNLGIAATLVGAGGLPVSLINEDGTPWTPGGEPDVFNIWRRFPSGRLDTQSMRRTPTGDAGAALANLFFEA